MHRRDQLYYSKSWYIHDLISACNCRGSWGAGIAASFGKLYPNSYNEHQAHCKNVDADKLLGTAQLIDCDEGHIIACLFTSKSYGRAVDSPDEILNATRAGLLDLKQQLRESAKEISACKFNSGLFKVPWEHTAGVIDEVGLDMTIYTPDNQSDS